MTFLGRNRRMGGSMGPLCLAWLAAGVLLALAGSGVHGPSAGPAVQRAGGGPVPARSPRVGSLESPAAVAVAADRTGIPSPAPASPVAPRARSRGARTLTPGLAWVQGVAVGIDGTALAGLTVAETPGDSGRSAITGADGSFRVPVGSKRGRLGVNTPGYLVVFDGIEEGLRVLTVARGRSVRVEVWSARTGAPLAGADVVSGLSAGITAADGGVELVVPMGTSAAIQVSRPGFASCAVAAEPGAGVVLARLETHRAETRLRGQVVDGARQPVSGAHVAAGGHMGRTDSQGRFDLPRGSGAEVEAFHPGVGAGTAQVPGSDADADPSAGGLTVVLAKAPPAATRAVSVEPLARIVPAAPDGQPQLLAPFWRTARADAAGRVDLPPHSGSFVAVSKGGAVVARFPNPAQPLTRSL